MSSVTPVNAAPVARASLSTFEKMGQSLLYFRVSDAVFSRWGVGLVALTVGIGACYGAAAAVGVGALAFSLLYALKKPDLNAVSKAAAQGNLVVLEYIFGAHGRGGGRKARDTLLEPIAQAFKIAAKNSDEPTMRLIVNSAERLEPYDIWQLCCNIITPNGGYLGAKRDFELPQALQVLAFGLFLDRFSQLLTMLAHQDLLELAMIKYPENENQKKIFNKILTNKDFLRESTGKPTQRSPETPHQWLCKLLLQPKVSSDEAVKEVLKALLPMSRFKLLSDDETFELSKSLQRHPTARAYYQNCISLIEAIRAENVDKVTQCIDQLEQSNDLTTLWSSNALQLIAQQGDPKELSEIKARLLIPRRV
jgi:hypothetical protein